MSIPGARALSMLLAVASVAVAASAWLGSRGGGSVTMAVWGMPFEDRLFEDVYARGFERAHPAPPVRVDYQRHADLLPKYNAWHARGKGAGVMRVRITDYHQLAARGMLEPLDAYIRGDVPGCTGLSPTELAEIPAALRAACEVEGVTYALPQDNAQYGLYVNRTMLDEYNRAHPGAPLEPSAEWTWEDLRHAARELTIRDAQGRVAQQGFDLVVWSWPFLNFFAQAGGELWSEGGTRTTIDSDAGVRALEFLGSLVKDGSWVPHFGKNQGAGPDARFAAGRTALYMDGSWMAPAFEQQNPSLNFEIVPVPRGEHRRVISGCVVWAMSSRAPDKALAWEMIRWLTRAEQGAAYWDMLRVAPPANTAVLASDQFMSARGVPNPDDPAHPIVPPMPREAFATRAAWLRYAVTPREDDGGRAPGFVPVSVHQTRLELEIEACLQEYLADVEHADARALLGRAAARVNAGIR